MLLNLLLIACTSSPGDKSNESELTCDTAVVGDTGVQVGLIDPSCRCEEPTLAIGTGMESYVPVAEGADVQMVHGPQGGWHVLSAVQITHTRNVVEMQARVYDVETGAAVTGDLVYRVQLVDDGGCVGSFPNMYLYLDVTALVDGERDTPPELLSCRQVRITVCASDTGGRELCEEKQVRVLPDPADIESGLAQACD